MLKKIENKWLSIEVNSMGAELYSLKAKETAFEYLWQGDESIWEERSPILFPIIGRLRNDAYKVKGIEYTLEKHGFAKKSPFELRQITEKSLSYRLKKSLETRAQYPYDYDLDMVFILRERTLSVMHRIINKGRDKMYFQIGGHPGFNCQIGDYLEFEKNETIDTQRLDKEALIMDQKFPLLKNEKRITITNHLFDHDALILTDFKSKKIHLKSRNDQKIVTVSFGEIPFLGLWAKPGAPYVCIEPWYGVDDDYNEVDDFSKKRGVVELDGLQKFEFTYEIEIHL